MWTRPSSYWELGARPHLSVPAPSLPAVAEVATQGPCFHTHTPPRLTWGIVGSQDLSQDVRLFFLLRRWPKQSRLRFPDVFLLAVCKAC